MKKTILGGVALAALVLPLALAPAANAASGDTPLNITFSGVGVTTLADVGATTDFALALPGGYGPNNGSIYDPGTYTIGTNPAAVHEAWADFSAANNPMLIVNGAQSLKQKVLAVTVTGQVCSTPGSTVTFDFSADATNILTPEWIAANAPGGAAGANLSVEINGEFIGSQDLTNVDPTNDLQIVGPVSAAADGQYTVVLWNNGTAYTGNDFAIDNIVLTQQGDCEPPCEIVTTGVWFNYVGKFSGTVAPALNDPKWHALPAQPGGQHDVNVRGYDKPYNPGAEKGKGDWFVWKNVSSTCP